MFIQLNVFFLYKTPANHHCSDAV